MAVPVAPAQEPTASREEIPALIGQLADPDPSVAGGAAEKLSRMGSAAVSPLIVVLREGAVSARWPATIALGKIGSDALPAVPELAAALRDTGALVRWGAAHALRCIGTGARPAAGELLLALSDRDQDVRAAASLALDAIDPSAVDVRGRWKEVAALVDSLVPALMKETGVPGASVALISDRSLVWSRQFGIADARTSAPVTSETMFEACSMSKPVFAFLAMTLVEERRLDLDRPLVEYLALPALRGQPGADRITARMVLAHTTGLPNWRKGEEEIDGPLPVAFPPGSRFGYSGEGYYYLQRVVERITSQPLDSFAHTTLFAPRGLKRMSFAWSPGLDPAIAAGHGTDGMFLDKTRYTHPNAGYTLYASAEDYARFVIEILRADGSPGDRLLNCAAVDTMLSRHVAAASRDPVERPGTARGTAVFWGLGWAINDTPGGEIIHHSGANRSGFRCFCQFRRVEGSGIVIMTNGLGGSDLWSRLISRVGAF